jgi:hypothetical protein
MYYTIYTHPSNIPTIIYYFGANRQFVFNGKWFSVTMSCGRRRTVTEHLQAVLYLDSDVDRTQILCIVYSVYILLRITIVRNIVELIVYKRQHYSCVRYCTAVVERNNYITSASLYQKPFSVQFVDVSTTICSGMSTLKCIYYYHPPHIARRLEKSLLMLSTQTTEIPET